MQNYDHKSVEEKWQKYWKEHGTNKTQDDPKKPKSYILDMFPYPSGEGLHVGHPKGYIATDIYSRQKRMQGNNVLHPMGWDAFGLPAEQYALKNKVHPRIAVEKNISRFKEQLAKIGFNYDWEREINTTDPDFYRWTQWIFKQLFKKGLAYESNEPINWCPIDKTGLSNEDLENGRCERCGSIVEKRAIRQWVLKITQYADRMLEDLEKLNWPESIKESQRNWIGKSEGAEITFALNVPGQEDGKHKVTVFTTRPDTLYGATFLAISHELAQSWIDIGWDPPSEVAAFVLSLKKEGEERENTFETIKEKRGIASGITAINPANGEKIPVWIANYVLSGYGTGAIMAVPAHDDRDYHFAKTYNIPVRQVIAPRIIQTEGPGAFRSNEPNKITHGIIALVKHWNDEKYLAIRWKEVPWVTLLTGGIEEGDTPEKTVLKELTEETGFTNAEIVDSFGVIDGLYYHVPKKENRLTHGYAFVVKLRGKEQENIAREEQDKHTLEWMTLEELKTSLTAETHKHLLARVMSGEHYYCGDGTMINSAIYAETTNNEAGKEIVSMVGGRNSSAYKLREWVFARQRYWGEPFPIVFDENHVSYAVADSELPVKLPDVEAYEPTDTGESPLANIHDWVKVWGIIDINGEFVSTEKDAPNARQFSRETNTMPQWAGSSWYYLRYIDPQNNAALVDKNLERIWSPVDFYVGGAEHATRHLIYARFWHKFLFDIGIVHNDEPFLRLQNVGLIQAEDGRKMSKRWGNVINPDDMVERFGADTLRLYEMFMGPFDQAIAWSTDGMVGTRRFIERIWRLEEKISQEYQDTQNTESLLNQSIKKVGEDIERFAFNTAISQLMIFVNHIEKQPSISTGSWKILLQLLAPFAPHVTEELWEKAGEKKSIHLSSWPVFDPIKIDQSTLSIAVQVNGKVRGTLVVGKTSQKEGIILEAKEIPSVRKWLEGKNIEKEIYVPGKIINFVVT